MGNLDATAHWQEKSCLRCPSLVACRKPASKVVVASPCHAGGILAIGEAPGGDEDLKGVGFVGSAGKKLRILLGQHGLSCSDYGVANICRCRPPENRKPNAQEIKSCLPYLASLIQETRPDVILAVGGRTSATIFCGPGTLHSKIDVRCKSGDWSAKTYVEMAHPSIRDALQHVRFVVPMPHTSPRALNCKAPSGEGWADIAEHQVSLAVTLLNR